jgi:hypothetical protein
MINMIPTEKCSAFYYAQWFLMTKESDAAHTIKHLISYGVVFYDYLKLNRRPNYLFIFVTLLTKQIT